MNHNEFSLNLVKDRLVKTVGWTDDFVERVTDEYIKFIRLKLIYSEDVDEMSPSDAIDMFWHQHILDTKNYDDFCHYLGGNLVHHNPYAYYNQNERVVRIKKTITAYKTIFEEDPPIDIWRFKVESSSPILGNKKLSNSFSNLKNLLFGNKKVNYRIVFIDAEDSDARSLFRSYKSVFRQNKDVIDSMVLDEENQTFYDLGVNCMKTYGQGGASAVTIFTCDDNYNLLEEMVTEYEFNLSFYGRRDKKKIKMLGGEKCVIFIYGSRMGC